MKGSRASKKIITLVKKSSLLGKRMNQEVSAEDLTTYNSTKKKVFAMIPFDQISTIRLMTPFAISLAK